MSTAASLVWFRQDLRLDDNPALRAAIARGGPVLPVFILPPEDECGGWSLGAASRWWLHHSLLELSRDLKRCGARLILRRGAARKVLAELVKETGASAVFWNRRYEPAAAASDAETKRWLIEERGIGAADFGGALLHEPSEIRTGAGRPYTIFTPFSRACFSTMQPGAPLPTPRRIRFAGKRVGSLMLDELELLPKLNWAAGFSETWRPGTAGAALAVRRFAARGLDRYAERRDQPAAVGTSRLSPHLHFGEISPRRIWHLLQKSSARLRARARSAGVETFTRELLWREFANHLLFHFPHTAERPLRESFERFPWRDDAAGQRAWQRGRTGYPIVDAGMRELWRSGWMHNRVRMIAASFLVKDLLIPWQAGARWFWETLVDADLANNTLGWQWTAGCGADAAPYFRIFNPVSQGEKFDPAGAYVRRWCPELAKLPNEWIHRPWEAPRAVLAAAGVAIGRSYPAPIVDHAAARKQALAALKRSNRGRSEHT